MTLAGLACAAGLALVPPGGSAIAVRAERPQPAAAGDAREQSHRATERLQALRREADALLAQERSLLLDLRRLEVQREIKIEEVRKLEADAVTVAAELGDTTRHLSQLERTRDAQAPALRARLVEIYKLGAGGYLRLLFGVDEARDAARAYRTVAALAALDRERARAHRSTLAALQQLRTELQVRQQKGDALRGEARAARAALDRAVTDRAALIASIDARRDLNAQLAGELQDAQVRLERAVSGLDTGPEVLPLAPFKGALDWPAPGAVSRRFGRGAGPGESAVPRTGMEIAARWGAPARAVHEGTIAHAAPFTGFGNLVIIDHGARAFSLYGYLEQIDVRPGARVTKGQAVGTVGTAPAGQAALYFELRVDGRAVDPLQWLKGKP